MVAPKIGFQINTKDAVAALKPKPGEIKRASRLTINKIVNSVHTDLGGTLPRGSGVQVGGFRRVRTKKQKAKGSNLRGTVWIGGNKIAAKYVGKPKNVPGGAQAGRHFFKGAFVATMNNGYTSVFKRSQNGGIKEETVDVKNLHPEAQRAVDKHSKGAKKILKSELEKILRRKK